MDSLERLLEKFGNIITLNDLTHTMMYKTIPSNIVKLKG